MNRIITFCVLFLITTIIYSCSKEKAIVDDNPTINRPFADYEIVPGDDPMTFDFVNKSSNYESIEWRFGDDSVSREASPTHVYATTGKFEVNLKVTSKDGSTARKLLIVSIDADDLADFWATPTDKENTVKLSYKLLDPTLKITSIKWGLNLDKEADTSSLENPTKTYEANQFIDANLTLKTEKGSVIVLNRKVTSVGSLTDVTNKYLVNTGPPFIAKVHGDRWGILADWIVNDAVKQRSGGMGSWDSYNNGKFLSMESWGGEAWIDNGKIYQTMTLPAGKYYFNAIYNDYTIRGEDTGKSYMVMAEGETLPDVDKVESTALGFYRLQGSSPTNVLCSMKITETKRVSLGLSCTMHANDQTIKCERIRLYKAHEE